MTSTPSPLPHRERLQALREEVRATARDRPGVYRFLGPRGECLYIGKSVRVRSRLLSYFRAASGSKGMEIVRGAAGVSWEYIPTEFEALLREYRLIRTLRPRFNVQHRRERRFAWVKLTGGPAPRLKATQVPTFDGHPTFGPFPAQRSLPDTLHRLARLQGLRDCAPSTSMHFSDQLDLLAAPLTPGCPRAELGSCLGPCAGLCSGSEYADRVRQTAAFLSGSTDEPLERLAAMRDAAALRRDYEGAGRLHESEVRLRTLRDEIVAFRTYIETLTFVYRIPIEGDRVRGYLLRRGRVRLAFDEDGFTGAERNALADQLRALLHAPDPSPATLAAEEREELFVTVRWFRRSPQELARVLPVSEYIAEGIAGRLAPPRTPLDTVEGPARTETGTAPSQQMASS